MRMAPPETLGSLAPASTTHCVVPVDHRSPTTAPRDTFHGAVLTNASLAPVSEPRYQIPSAPVGPGPLTRTSWTPSPVTSATARSLLLQKVLMVWRHTMAPVSLRR